MQRKSSSKCFRQTILSTASMFLCTTPIHLVETTVICFYLGSNYFKRKSRFLGPWQGCKRTEGELRDRKCLNVIISLSGWHFSGILPLPSCRFDSSRVSLLAQQLVLPGYQQVVTWDLSGIRKRIFRLFLQWSSLCSESFAMFVGYVAFSSLIKNVSYCEKYTCPQQMFTSLI